jgi:cytochrome c
MPWNAPGSLSDDDTYSVVAWMLWANGLLPRDAVLDRGRLPLVKMPALSRFVFDEMPLKEAAPAAARRAMAP